MGNEPRFISSWGRSYGPYYDNCSNGCAGTPPCHGSQGPTPFRGADNPLNSLLADVCRVYDEMWRGSYKETTQTGPLPPESEQPHESASEKVCLPIFLNLMEGEESYFIAADIPDVCDEDIDVCYQDGLLSIYAERKGEHKIEGDKNVWHIIERPHGAYQRTLPLPQSIYADKIEAKYSNGVLSIVLPKIKPSEGIGAQRTTFRPI